MANPVIASPIQFSSLLKRVEFADKPRIDHAKLTAAPVLKDVSATELRGVCNQKNIEAALLDRLQTLQAGERRQVYEENADLRRALGVKGESGFKKIFNKTIGRIFTDTGSRSPALLDALDRNRFNTELARFVISTEEHRQNRGMQKMIGNIENGEIDGSGAISIMKVLLRKENLAVMGTEARHKTKQLLRDLLQGSTPGVNLSPKECAELLCVAYELLDQGDKSLLRRIRHDVQSRAETFRGEMLATTLEVVSEYAPKTRQLIFDVAMRPKTRHTAGESNRRALLAYLNQDPRPKLTEAASRNIASELVKRLSEKAPPDAQAAVVKFVLPVAISMKDGGDGQKLIRDLLAKVDKDRLLTNPDQETVPRMPEAASRAIAQFILPAAKDMEDSDAAAELVDALVKRMDKRTLLECLNQNADLPLDEEVKRTIANTLIGDIEAGATHDAQKEIAKFVLSFASGMKDRDTAYELTAVLTQTMDKRTLLDCLDQNASLPLDEKVKCVIANKLISHIESGATYDEQNKIGKFVLSFAGGMEDSDTACELADALADRMSKRSLLDCLNQDALLPMNGEVKRAIATMLICQIEARTDHDEQKEIAEFVLSFAGGMKDSASAHELIDALSARMDTRALLDYLSWKPALPQEARIALARAGESSRHLARQTADRPCALRVFCRPRHEGLSWRAQTGCRPGDEDEADEGKPGRKRDRRCAPRLAVKRASENRRPAAAKHGEHAPAAFGAGLGDHAVEDVQEQGQDVPATRASCKRQSAFMG